MGAVLPDDVFSDGTDSRPAAQVPDGLHELGVERQGHAIVVLSLQHQAAHFPAAKLSVKSHGKDGQTRQNCTKGHRDLVANVYSGSS